MGSDSRTWQKNDTNCMCMLPIEDRYCEFDDIQPDGRIRILRERHDDFVHRQQVFQREVCEHCGHNYYENERRKAENRKVAAGGANREKLRFYY